MAIRTVIHSDESYSIRLWVLNYLVALEPFGFDFKDAELVAYSEDELSKIGYYDLFEVKDMEFVKDGKKVVFSNNNTISMHGFNFDHVKGTIRFTSAPLGKTIEYISTAPKKNVPARRAEVNLQWDSLDNVEVVVVYKEVEEIKYRGTYSFKHMDQYEKPKNYFKKIASDVNTGLNELAKKRGKEIEPIIICMIDAMLKDDRLHDELSARLSKIPSNVETTCKDRIAKATLGHDEAIEQFTAKEDDKLKSTKSNLMSRKNHRLELLKNAIDDDTGLLVLTKTL